MKIYVSGHVRNKCFMVPPSAPVLTRLTLWDFIRDVQYAPSSQEEVPFCS